jgi:hypothetical protein
MLFLVAAVAALSLPSCDAVRGEAQLWAHAETRYVIVGEVHGTVEAPALFGDLVCAAHVSGRPVVVAIELADIAQPALDAFLASDGGGEAAARFLASPIWHLPMRDGRSSRAYLQLIERLRRLKQAGAVAGVLAIQPTGDSARSATQSGFNADMADLIRAAGARAPNALVLVLVGNFHARKHAAIFNGARIVPAAADLPPSETLSLTVQTTGEAWNCTTPTDCGPRQQPSGQPDPRGVILTPGSDGDYDGFIGLGVVTTASPPAVP